MSRNSVIAALLMALMLSCAQSALADDLIDADKLTPELVNYKTCEIVYGEYTKDASQGGYQVYVIEQNLNIGEGTAHLKNLKLIRNAEVKAGDVLVTFERDGSRAELEAQKLNYQRASEEYERGLKSRKTDISDMKAAERLISDATEKQLAQAKIRLAELECEKYVFETEYELDSQRRAIDELEEYYADDCIIAPFDGVVTYVATKTAGDTIYANETLITLQSQARYVIGLDNGNGNFRYGMDVTVSLGPRNNKVEVPGRIIAAGGILPDDVSMNYALVELYGEADAKQLRTISVSGHTVDIKNVLMITRKASKLDGGKSYVSILDGDMVQKRIVVLGHNTGTETWVLQGLEEGQLVILD